MMRRSTALAALGFVLVLPTLTVAKGTEHPAQHVSGTVTVWNAASKRLTLKDTAGKETTVAWNDKTMVRGTPQVGAPVNVAYRKDKNDKMWATAIQSGTKPVPRKESLK
jgi:hypothetical protein